MRYFLGGSAAKRSSRPVSREGSISGEKGRTQIVDDLTSNNSMTGLTLYQSDLSETELDKKEVDDNKSILGVKVYKRTDTNGKSKFTFDGLDIKISDQISAEAQSLIKVKII